MERQEIQTYINNFRRLISQFLKPNVGIQSIIHSYDKGVVIVYELSLNLQNKDDFRSDSKDVSEALKRTNLFENEEHNTSSFGGTNIFLIKNKIVVIKDDKSQEWTEEKAQLDINRILTPIKEKTNG